MKGVIVDCLKHLVVDNFGEKKWDEILKEAGYTEGKNFLPSDNINDDEFFKMIGETCKSLKISTEQAADLFGEYWMNKYATKIYSAFFIGKKSAKEFILDLDKIHHITTQTMENAHPPRFDYDMKDENTLIITYKSNRDLIDFAVSLIKGVGKYYKETIDVSKIGSNKIKVVFDRK